MSPSTGHSLLLCLLPNCFLLLCILPLLRLLFNFIWLSFKRKSACNSIFHAPPGCVCTQGVTAGLEGSRRGLPYGQEGIKTMKDYNKICVKGIFGTQFQQQQERTGKAHPILLMSCEAIPLPSAHSCLSPSPLPSFDKLSFNR